MLAWIELGWRQFVPSIDGVVVLVLDQFLRYHIAHLPDEVIIGFRAEPVLQDATDAKPTVLRLEEAPRALQP